MKKVLLFFVLLVNISFGCKIPNAHQIVQQLIQGNVVEIKGEYMLINQEKMQKIVNVMPEVAIALSIYSDDHKLKIEYK